MLHCRSCILPQFVGCYAQTYNGKCYVCLKITEQMVGQKLETLLLFYELFVICLFHNMLLSTCTCDLFGRMKRNFCEKLYKKSSFFYSSLDFHSSFNKKEFLVVNLFMPIKEPSNLYLIFETNAFLLRQFISLFVF